MKRRGTGTRSKGRRIKRGGVEGEGEENDEKEREGGGWGGIRVEEEVEKIK